MSQAKISIVHDCVSSMIPGHFTENTGFVKFLLFLKSKPPSQTLSSHPIDTDVINTTLFVFVFFSWFLSRRNAAIYVRNKLKGWWVGGVKPIKKCLSQISMP